MDTAPASERNLRPLAVAAVAGAVLLAAAALVAWLADSPFDSPFDSPAAYERLEKMGCRELAAEILEGREAKRRAALEIFVRKKCI